MKMLSDILRRETVWVNPGHRVQSALYLMRGHALGCLPVLDGNRLVGMLAYPNVLGVDAALTVGEVMNAASTLLPQTLSLREAAEVLTRMQQDFLPVVDAQNLFLGIVTCRDLLAELRRPADPLTELPWSDTMREWATEMLQAGHEITIIFLDVNDFGTFNKLYGHVVGDTVLQTVAEMLRGLTNADTESLCRYGGDEFCIVTLRHAEEAEDLAERIVRDTGYLRVTEMPDQQITMTYGIRGGRRTREREQIHYASTLNNLINLASRDCMLRKASGRSAASEPARENRLEEAVVQAIQSPPMEPPVSPAPPEAPAAPPALQNIHLAGLDVRFDTNLTQVRVELSTEISAPAGASRPEPTDNSYAAPRSDEALPLASYSVSLPRAASQMEILRLVAEATLGALSRLLSDRYALRVEDVFTHATADNRPLVTVLGIFQTPEDRRPIAGTAFIGDDLFRAAANAALAAANRQVTQYAAAPDQAGE